jgi:excisionase family DNA binding protein
LLQNTANSSEWCNIRQAAAHLGISISFIRKAVRLKQIPFARLGSKALRFRRSELDRWAQTNGCGVEVSYVERGR